MMYLVKWCIYSEHSGNHIVSLTDKGEYQCDCIGWTRHMPRRNCKHIYQVIDEKPEPLDKESWDALNGKKHKVVAFMNKIKETELQIVRRGKRNESNKYKCK